MNLIIMILQDRIVYEEVGDGLAMGYFQLDSRSGNLYVQKDLMTTSQENFLVRS